MQCPKCGVEMRLLPGEKFWVHAFDKKVKCPITSISNYPPPTTPPTEPVAA